ncbi:rhodanese-like domain-containing protein [Alloalcanivorax gelatiniphagus]|uniref:Rhodanese-like domain-containing protein n=1 Tax=Alloalcanivorax gelatiniphagus TaxID=1194167 RepID=A0ABY2XS95_9GAMM|nr:rhodanese-like domain-containing protein [Alloalcanivorax gelatiniphagus]TMW14821.1 rhodanese-like domain-containing protein [Alloalcanivorax gelatiniphagus]
MTLNKTVADLVADAEARIHRLTADQARALAGDPAVRFVDIRDVRELKREGTLPGALHAPRGMLEFWVDPDSAYHKPDFATGQRFVLFCALGHRSALATAQLMDMGFGPVCDIEGGFKAWREAGGTVEERG